MAVEKEKQRVNAAIKAMKKMGFPGNKVSHILKNLLKVYDKSWEFIEAENYRVLLEALLESQESTEDSGKKSPAGDFNMAVCESPCKRLKPNATTSNNISPSTEQAFGQSFAVDKQSEQSPIHYARERRNSTMTPSTIGLKELKTEPGLELPPQADVPVVHHSLMKPKTEPVTDDCPQYEVPIAVIHPHTSAPLRDEVDPCPCPSLNEENSTMGVETNVEGRPSSDRVEATDEEISVDAGNSCDKEANLDLVYLPEPQDAGNLEIASSSMGEIKLSLSCGSLLNRPGFHIPDIDEVMNLVEEKCLKSYRFIDHTFTFRNLMKEFCQSFLELGTEESNDKLREGHLHIDESIGDLNRSFMQSVLRGGNNLPEGLCKTKGASNGSSIAVSQHVILNTGLESTGNCGINMEGGPQESRDPRPSCLVSKNLEIVRHSQFSFDDVRPCHDVHDITKGEEKVRISIINEVSSEEFPPSFQYIPQNMVYQNAYINFSLARIGNEDCCPDCFVDCLSSSIPCACARETGGEFAYTQDGRIKKEFLDECISMNRDPHKHRLFYCHDCPIERSKNEAKPDPCKGHLVRKFIKECWSKCGCSKQCGNRVVQRGITTNLQVFLTPEGKGWALRTLEDLPRGTFVCEYVGEILTNTELYERNVKSSGNERHTYPVLLDADWGSEGVLKDEEALCLDATFYGNVARFINHRCVDANLVEIPVEVEAPDHHYYHLAFFTTRTVSALEELTWDYGIDFDDHSHPVKAFRCRCGSKFCRDSKRSTKSKRLMSLPSVPPLKPTGIVFR